jgi:Na+/glutamate symporter
MIIELDMYQTLAIAVVVLMLGKFLRKKHDKKQVWGFFSPYLCGGLSL